MTKPKIVVSVRLDEEDHIALGRIAVQRSIGVSDVIREALTPIIRNAPPAEEGKKP